MNGINGNRPRRLKAAELAEIQEMCRIVAHEKWKAMHIKGNTALLPNGQELSRQAEALTMLLENEKNLFVSEKLASLGYDAGTPVSLDLKTGDIKLV